VMMMMMMIIIIIMVLVIIITIIYLTTCLHFCAVLSGDPNAWGSQTYFHRKFTSESHRVWTQTGNDVATFAPRNSTYSQQSTTVCQTPAYVIRSSLSRLRTSGATPPRHNICLNGIYWCPRCNIKQLCTLLLCALLICYYCRRTH